jgi:Ig-like domain from next to BRCA1 gene
MKLHTLLTISLFVLVTLSLVACSLPSTEVSTPDPGLVFTQAAQTAAALPTTIPPSPAPTIAITQFPPTATIEASPTSTSTSLPTATPTISPTPDQATCTDTAKFVSDVTIPDNTELLPGEEFVKTWRLQNTGTCTWTSQYALIFVSGDQMNGISPLPLTGSTAPGSIVDLSVNLKAPGTIGTYRGDWQLRNATGASFGTGTNANQPFFVQIKVVEGISELNLGSPTWTDTMDNSTNWYLLDTANTQFTMNDGKMVMKALHPGGDEWGISNRPSMQDYYLQATFITGDTCSGTDKYGLLGRAPDPDKGYVFEFSCDGRYRLYIWDGQNYNALQEWSAASSIKAGANQTNIMGLWMQGSTIRLYANGHKIAEFTDSSFDHGQFGLVIGSSNTDNLTVYVDLVEYWKFDQ